MDGFHAIEADAFFRCGGQNETPYDQKRTSVSRPNFVLLGRIVAAHGLKGEVVIHSFTEVPEDIAAYGPLLMGEGKASLELVSVRSSEKGVIACVAGVADRTAAEALKGTELWVERDRLPPPDEGEFYHADLIGLAAVSPDGQQIGSIIAVQNYGAGDLIEIRLDGTQRTELVPFSDTYVPAVDLAEGRVVVRIPTTTSEGDEPASEP